MLKYFEFQETLANMCQDIFLTSSVQYPALTNNYTLLKDFIRKHIYNTRECIRKRIPFLRNKCTEIRFLESQHQLDPIP